MLSCHYPEVDCRWVFWSETMYKNYDVFKVEMSDVCVPISNKSVKETAEQTKVKVLENILGIITKVW